MMMRRRLFSSFSSSKNRKIVIALSGGVDSSVVAYLMKQKFGGDSLLAVYMSNWESRDEDLNDNDGVCPNSQDWDDAQQVAQHLQLPIRYTQFQSDYWTQVFEPYVDSVVAGKRNNPDVDCNRYIKFGALQDYIQTHLSSDGDDDTILATGHYARLWHRNISREVDWLIEEMIQNGIDNPDNNNQQQSYEWIRNWGLSDTPCPLLLSARDTTKCQTLFLSGVSGTSFRNVMFPLGNLYKGSSSSSSSSKSTATNNDSNISSSCEMTVREIAQQLANLPNANKRDSMGICFVGKRKGGFNNFMNQYLENFDEEGGEESQQPPFQFVDVDTGEIIPHQQQQHPSNILLYTKGQGAKISGASKAWFVSDVDLDNNTVWVCNDTHHPSLYTNVFYIRAMNWIGGGGGGGGTMSSSALPTPLVSTASATTSPSSKTSNNTLYAKCRIRNLQPLVDCTVTLVEESSGKSKSSSLLYRIETTKPLRAVTPGQQCAIYLGPTGLICLGGGMISQSGPTLHELGKLDLGTRSNDKESSSLHPAGHNDLSVC